MADGAPKAGGEEFKMVLALGQQNRRAAFCQRSRDVVQNEAVALLVGRQGGVERLDAVHRHRAIMTERGLADDQPVIERPLRRLAPGVDGETHRAKLHLGDRVKAVPPARRGRQPGDEARLHLGQYSLERHGRDMVALVDDHMAVRRDEVVDAPQAHETLDHRHIQAPSECMLAGADLADSLGGEAEEHGQLGNPLIEERLTVDQHERAPGSRCDQIRANYGLAHAWRRDEQTDVLAKQSPCGLLLNRRELALKGEIQGLPLAALILDDKGASMFPQDLLESSSATAREHDVLR